MREIFFPESKIIAERKLWISVMRAQAKLGHAIDSKIISDYEKAFKEYRRTGYMAPILNETYEGDWVD